MPAENTIKSDHTPIFALNAGIAVWRVCPASRAGRTAIQTSTPKKKSNWYVICGAETQHLAWWSRGTACESGGYTRRPESLFRLMRRLELFPQPKPKPTHTPKPYEQMQYPGQRVQIDVKVKWSVATAKTKNSSTNPVAFILSKILLPSL